MAVQACSLRVLVLCLAVASSLVAARKKHRKLAKDSAVGSVCYNMSLITKSPLWECDNKVECIDLQYKCDGTLHNGKNDCSDNSDEHRKYCGCGGRVDPTFCAQYTPTACDVNNPAILHNPPLQLAATYVNDNCPVLCNACTATATTTETTTPTTSFTSTATSSLTSTDTSTASTSDTTSTTTTTTTVTPVYIDLRSEQFSDVIKSVLITLGVVTILLILLLIYHKYERKRRKRNEELNMKRQEMRKADIQATTKQSIARLSNKIDPGPPSINGRPVMLKSIRPAGNFVSPHINRAQSKDPFTPAAPTLIPQTHFSALTSAPMLPPLPSPALQKRAKHHKEPEAPVKVPSVFDHKQHFIIRSTLSTNMSADERAELQKEHDADPHRHATTDASHTTLTGHRVREQPTTDYTTAKGAHFQISYESKAETRKSPNSRSVSQDPTHQ